MAACTRGKGWRRVSCKYRITACQRRRFSRETAAGRLKNFVCVSKRTCLPTHARLLLFLAQHQPAAVVLFLKFLTLNSRSIDFLIEAAAPLTVAFNPEPQLLASKKRKSSSLHRLSGFLGVEHIISKNVSTQNGVGVSSPSAGTTCRRLHGDPRSKR